MQCPAPLSAHAALARWHLRIVIEGVGAFADGKIWRGRPRRHRSGIGGVTIQCVLQNVGDAVPLSAVREWCGCVVCVVLVCVVWVARAFAAVFTFSCWGGAGFW